MLQTIEVEIDMSGHIHPLEPLSQIPTGRALLTLLTPDSLASRPLPPKVKEDAQSKQELFTPLFGILKANRSVSLADMEIAIRQRAIEVMDDRD